MFNFSKLSKTEVSAYLSVALFGITILINAVGPAQADDINNTNSTTASPTVSYKA